MQLSQRSSPYGCPFSTASSARCLSCNASFSSISLGSGLGNASSAIFAARAYQKLGSHWTRCVARSSPRKTVAGSPREAMRGSLPAPQPVSEPRHGLGHSIIDHVGLHIPELGADLVDRRLRVGDIAGPGRLEHCL